MKFGMSDICQNALFGSLMGDALGTPHKGKTASELAAYDYLHMVMPNEYKKSFPDIPYGTWGAAGSQQLCLLRSLAMQAGRFIEDDFLLRLSQWKTQGVDQAGGIVFECDPQTVYAIEKLQNRAETPLNGVNKLAIDNGALKRSLTAFHIPIIWRCKIEDAYEVAVSQSLATHNDLISEACCLLYVAFAIELMIQPSMTISTCLERAVENAIHWSQSLPGLQSRIEFVVQRSHQVNVTGSNAPIDSFWSAVWALTHGASLYECLQAAVSLGNDTSGTASLVGGLSGIRHGTQSIPGDWWGALKGIELVPLLCD